MVATMLGWFVTAMTGQIDLPMMIREKRRVINDDLGW
jgi:hypothetical protein